MINEVFKELGIEIGEIVQKKNEAYGDATAKVPEILKILYPYGINIDQYLDASIIIRVLDKICRISSGNFDAFDENPWRDITGYGILGQRYHIDL